MRKGLAANGANDLESIIADLNAQMLEAAGELKFELAGRLRDEVSELKRELRQMEKAGHLA
jgi:excinuclease ABC subunit B